MPGPVLIGCGWGCDRREVLVGVGLVQALVDFSGEQAVQAVDGCWRAMRSPPAEVFGHQGGSESWAVVVLGHAGGHRAEHVRRNRTVGELGLDRVG